MRRACQSASLRLQRRTRWARAHFVRRPATRLALFGARWSEWRCSLCGRRALRVREWRRALGEDAAWVWEACVFVGVGVVTFRARAPFVSGVQRSRLLGRQWRRRPSITEGRRSRRPSIAEGRRSRRPSIAEGRRSRRPSIARGRFRRQGGWSGRAARRGRRGRWRPLCRRRGCGRVRWRARRCGVGGRGPSGPRRRPWGRNAAPGDPG